MSEKFIEILMKNWVSVMVETIMRIDNWLGERSIKY